MLILNGSLLNVTQLEARGNYPPGCLVAIYDAETSGALNLMAPAEMLPDLNQRDLFSPIALRLRWRLIDLASLGGTGRGKAYRLSAIALDERPPAKP